MHINYRHGMQYLCHSLCKCTEPSIYWPEMAIMYYLNNLMIDLNVFYFVKIDNLVTGRNEHK